MMRSPFRMALHDAMRLIAFIADKTYHAAVTGRTTREKKQGYRDMSENAGKETVRAFIDAFNKLDSSEMANTFNFPHIRLARGKFAVFESRKDFIQRFDADKTALQAEGWSHTVIESLELVHAVPDKVHLAIEYTRRRADDSVYCRFNSFRRKEWLSI